MVALRIEVRGEEQRAVMSGRRRTRSLDSSLLGQMILKSGVKVLHAGSEYQVQGEMQGSNTEKVLKITADKVQGQHNLGW